MVFLFTGFTGSVVQGDQSPTSRRARAQAEQHRGPDPGTRRPSRGRRLRPAARVLPRRLGRDDRLVLFRKRIRTVCGIGFGFGGWRRSTVVPRRRWGRRVAVRGGGARARLARRRDGEVYIRNEFFFFWKFFWSFRSFFLRAFISRRKFAHRGGRRELRAVAGRGAVPAARAEQPYGWSTCRVVREVPTRRGIEPARRRRGVDAGEDAPQVLQSVAAGGLRHRRFGVGCVGGWDEGRRGDVRVSGVTCSFPATDQWGAHGFEPDDTNVTYTFKGDKIPSSVLFRRHARQPANQSVCDLAGSRHTAPRIDRPSRVRRIVHARARSGRPARTFTPRTRPRATPP